MMTYILIYIAGVIGFCVWDALVGWGVDFNGNENPPAIIPALFWPVAVVILMLLQFIDLLSSAKRRRINREKEKSRIRIKLEQEARRQQEEVEAEIEKLEQEERLGRRL